MADLVKTTLGPKGMDKILQSMGEEHSRKKITVTNDGNFLPLAAQGESLCFVHVSPIRRYSIRS